MKTFIKSSVRIKADPAYYRRKWSECSRAIHRIIERCAELDPTGCAPMTPEEKSLRSKLPGLEAKQRWAADRLASAIGMMWDARTDFRKTDLGYVPVNR